MAQDAPLQTGALTLAPVPDKRRATPHMLRTYRKERLRWDDVDAEAKRDADARNALESFIFETKSRVEADDFVAGRIPMTP